MIHIRYKQFILVLLLFINFPLTTSLKAQEVSHTNGSDQAFIAEQTLEEEKTESSLGSLGLIGSLILIVLSSFIGAYFLRDEFS